ncbi:MAG: VPLPA-CTERM-specific exosortase XrtD [Smithellaceae bacterium]|nr:VPLPA-CTERM-specific exosortase XrtD [Smithellaceae bacterium]
MMKLALPGLITTIFLLAFLPVFQKLVYRWGSGDNSYCYLIVPLFIYLCWEKRKTFEFGRFSWNLWGLIPVTLSVLMMVAGELGSMETLLFIGIWSCIVGVMLILYGLRLRRLLFPLLILAFIVPLPPFVNQMLTFNLKIAASTLSVMMLRLAGVSVLQEGNIIDLGITQLQMVDACSGLRYFMPLILMSLLLGLFFCRRFWQKAVLLVIVLPLSIAVNALRVFATGMLHVWGHSELAESFFHDLSGLVIFLLAGAILFGFAMAMRGLRIGGIREEVEAQSSKVKAQRGELKGKGSREGKKIRILDDKKDRVEESSKLQSLKRPVLITVGLCLLFAVSGYALQKFPSATNLPARKSFESFPMTIGDWHAKRHFLSQEILDSLWADDYVSATYYKEKLPNTINLLIPFYEYQGTRHTAHAPQSCMLGGGWAMIGSQEHVVKTSSGTALTLMTTIWEKGDMRILGSYFFFQRGRVITSPWMNKYWLMVDAFTRRRTDGALVRAEMTLVPGQSMEAGYEVLGKFVSKMYEVLPEYVPE